MGIKSSLHNLRVWVREWLSELKIMGRVFERLDVIFPNVWFDGVIFDAQDGELTGAGKRLVCLSAAKLMWDRIGGSVPWPAIKPFIDGRIEARVRVLKASGQLPTQNMTVDRLAEEVGEEAPSVLAEPA